MFIGSKTTLLLGGSQIQVHKHLVGLKHSSLTHVQSGHLVAWQQLDHFGLEVQLLLGGAVLMNYFEVVALPKPIVTVHSPLVSLC